MKLKEVRGGNEIIFTEVREPIYISLEDSDLNLNFKKEEVLKVSEYIEAGATMNEVVQIAYEMNRRQEEILLLMADRLSADIIAKTGEITDKFIALEGTKVNWFWKMRDVRKVDRLHNNGESIFNISKKLKRELIDVMVLVIDRSLKGYIRGGENA